MNAPLTISDAFAALSFAGRNPSWAEFEKASPAERRAILARWNEIIAGPVQSWDHFNEIARCMGKRHRAFASVRQRYEEPRGFNGEQDFDGRQTGSMQPHEWGE